jgi:NAD(P)H dehydrogenase (quinone)
MDALVIVHPVWWFAPPANLKGWIDQVLMDGVAIEQPPEGPPRPLLSGRRALLIQTFNAPRAADRIFMRNLAEQFWRRAVFASTGIDQVERVALYGVEALAESELLKAEHRIECAVERLTR